MRWIWAAGFAIIPTEDAERFHDDVITKNIAGSGWCSCASNAPIVFNEACALALSATSGAFPGAFPTLLPYAKTGYVVAATASWPYIWPLNFREGEGMNSPMPSSGH